MSKKSDYYIVKEEALPEVLTKVLEVKKMIECEEGISIADAVKEVGISRSSFYKYKDAILPFFEATKEKAITFGMKIDDEPGFLAEVLLLFRNYGMNVKTLHQTLPINRVADVTCTVSISEDSGDIRELIEDLEAKEKVHKIKILARE